jgi:CHASE2 domain-containing sensor protein
MNIDMILLYVWIVLLVIAIFTGNLQTKRSLLMKAASIGAALSAAVLAIIYVPAELKVPVIAFFGVACVYVSRVTTYHEMSLMQKQKKS